MNVVEQQHIYLSRLQEIQGTRPVLVQRPQGGDLNIEGKFWVDWRKSWTSLPLITCSVLTNQIAFDPDQRDWTILKQGMDSLVVFLDREKIPYLLSWSGGKGVHLEIFFKKDNIELPEYLAVGIEKHKIDVGRTIRTFLATWLLERAKVDPETIKLDWGKIKWSGSSKGSMIRVLGCQRPNGGVKTLISQIPGQTPAPNTLPLVFPEHIQTWDISFLKDNIVQALAVEIENNTPEEPDPFVAWINTQIQRAKDEGRLKESKSGKGKCIGLKNALASGIREGHRDEVATGLAIALRFWKGESRENTRAIMLKWCATCTPPFDIGEAARKIENVFRKQKMDYSPCTFFMMAGLCENSKCKVRKGKPTPEAKKQ